MVGWRVANENRDRGRVIYRTRNGKEGMDDGGWRGIDGARCVGLTSEVMNMRNYQGMLASGVDRRVYRSRDLSCASSSRASSSGGRLRRSKGETNLSDDLRTKDVSAQKRLYCGLQKSKNIHQAQETYDATAEASYDRMSAY